MKNQNKVREEDMWNQDEIGCRRDRNKIENDTKQVYDEIYTQIGARKL